MEDFAKSGYNKCKRSLISKITLSGYISKHYITYLVLVSWLEVLAYLVSKAKNNDAILLNDTLTFKVRWQVTSLRAGITLFARPPLTPSLF